MAITLSGGVASPSAGETSPAQIGLMLLPLTSDAVEAAATVSVAVMLRKVSDNLPSSVATLIFSACSGVTLQGHGPAKTVARPGRLCVKGIDRQHAQVLNDCLADGTAC